VTAIRRRRQAEHLRVAEAREDVAIPPGAATVRLVDDDGGERVARPPLEPPAPQRLHARDDDRRAEQPADRARARLGLLKLAAEADPLLDRVGRLVEQF